MKWKIKFFKAFSYTWTWLAFALVSLNLMAEGLAAGWWTTPALSSPSAWRSFAVVIILLAPGVMAQRWVRQLEDGCYGRG